MNSEINYVRTIDGASIACSTAGTGNPLLYVPPMPFTHLQAELRIPEHRRAHEHWASRFRYIRFDGRGSGLSDRLRTEFSLETLTDDLAAVVDALKMERFSMLAYFHAASPALLYAARWPERVNRIVLWGASADPAVYLRTAELQALISLIDKDWPLFALTTAHAWLGWEQGLPAQRFADMVMDAATPASAQAFGAALAHLDVTDILPLVRAPVLILNPTPSADHTLDPAWATHLAGALPHATLRFVGGVSRSPFVGHGDEVLIAAETFLCGNVPPAAYMGQPRSASAALTARQGDVLRLVASGRTNKEIALELGLSVHTIERHVANIYLKIGARGRADATAYALRHGISRR